MNRILKKLRKKNKKGISVVIGYVLLISMAVAMSIVVYQWLNTYVPKDTPKCPDDTSLTITELVCDTTADAPDLKLKLRNNGLFDVNGYFIRATTSQDQELATFDLSRRNRNGLAINTDYVSVDIPINTKTDEHIFGLYDHANGTLHTIYSIEIVPIRIQEDEKKINRTVSCTNSQIKEKITCPAS